MSTSFDEEKYMKENKICLDELERFRRKEHKKYWEVVDFIENVVDSMRHIKGNEEVMIRIKLSQMLKEEFDKLQSHKGCPGYKLKAWDNAMIYNMCKVMENREFYKVARENNIDISKFIPCFNIES